MAVTRSSRSPARQRPKPSTTTRVVEAPAPSATTEQQPAATSWAAGPGLIVLSTYLQLAPKFVVSSALLVDGRGDVELVARKGLAAALVASLCGEMLFTALRPAGLPLRWAGALLLLSVAVNALHTAAAYAGWLGPGATFWLQALSGFLAIPVQQCAALWRLGQRRSPAKWRMVGWILSVGLGTVPLLLPFTAAAVPTVVFSAAFPFAIALALCAEGSGASSTHASKSKAAVAAAAPAAVAPLTALHFVALTVLLGTNAEAINDVATGLRVRASLSQGRRALALTNNASVLLSQLLALLSDRGLDRGSERARCLAFLGAWGGCQLLRGLGMAALDGGGAAAQSLLAAFVFCDKYTGPLGQAAVDTAGVALLQAHALPPAASGGGGGGGRRLAIPAAFLVSLRAASFRYERPLWEILLMREGEWPLRFTTVVLALLSAVTAGVVHALLTCLREPKPNAKTL